jgi:hypothetical protein
MRDLPTIALIRPDLLLRRKGPVPGILAAGQAGAIMDKSKRRFVLARTALFTTALRLWAWQLRCHRSCLSVNSVKKRHFLRSEFGH